MGQYANDLPAENPNPTQEVIVYRNPLEKEMWDRIQNGEHLPAGAVALWCFMAFFFCFIFSKVFVGFTVGPFIKFGSPDWWEKHEKMERFSTVLGILLGSIAAIFVWMNA